MRKAFTLMEIMIVLSITVAIMAVAIPMYVYFNSFSVVESARIEVLENIRLAESKAQNGMSDSNFGVYFGSNFYTVYQGASYAERTQSQDTVSSLPKGVTLSGLTEINFTKKTGAPNTAGVLTLTYPDGSQKTIQINSAGLIY